MEGAASGPVPATQQPVAAVPTAWPRSAQLALAFLLGLAAALLVVHCFSFLRRGSRPTELERAPGLSYRIDLNKAERAELLQLPGIGDSLAERIEAYRRDHGAFHSVNELTEVRGIGPATLERMRSWIQVSSESGGDVAEGAGIRSRKDAEAPRSAAGNRKPAGKKEASLSKPIDINRANAAELQRLPGVGPKMSQRIVDERQKGPFKSIDDLRRVQGIGAKTLERLRPFIIVEGDADRVASGNKS